MKSTREQSNAKRWATILCLTIIGGLGCAVLSEPSTPQHHWSEEWGPMVPHSTFPTDCSICHIPDNWKVIKGDFEFDHEQETGVALTGAHQQAACLRCHNDRGPVQAYTARGCGGCHEDPHKSTLGLDCTKCHNELWWQPDGLILEHNNTRFPLAGAHAITACESCHPRATVGEFLGTPVECHLCHQQEVVFAEINHIVNGWIVDCQDCHDASNWRPFNFNHNIFPLQGGHAGLDCTQCHVGGQINGTPNDCYSCHMNDYINTQTHVAGGFPTDCTLCHDIFDWTPN